MKLAGRVPVEPLDEERLTNIERRVVSGAVDAAVRGEQRRAPHRLIGRAVVVVAIAAAGAIGWTLRAGTHTGSAGEPAPVAVHTAAQRSTIDIGDARIESGPDTAFAVTRPGGGVLIALSRGKLALAVDKRGERPPLVVRAGDTDVVVVGTRFSVDCGDGRGEVDVEVTDGAVRVVRGAQDTRVAAGQRWRTHGGLVAALAPAAPAHAGDATAGGDGDRAGSEAATATVAIAEPGTVAAAGSAVGEPSRSTPAVPRPPRTTGAATAGRDPRVDRSVAPRGTSSAPPGRGRVAAASAADAARGDLRAQIRAQRVEPALDLGEPDAAAAVARYYEIAAHHSGDEASQAFYSIAAVQALRLGRGDDALQTLDAYVRRFPGGKEYRAALWLRVRLLCLDRLDDRCRAAAYTYLHAAPDSPAAPLAERLTQTR